MSQRLQSAHRRLQQSSLVLLLPDLSNRFFHAQAAEVTDYKCCALKYDYDGQPGTPPEGLTAEEYCESSDAEGHWCEYVNWEQYAVCQTGGIVVFIICGAIAVCAVLQVTASAHYFSPPSLVCDWPVCQTKGDNSVHVELTLCPRPRGLCRCRRSRWCFGTS